MQNPSRGRERIAFGLPLTDLSLVRMRAHVPKAARSPRQASLHARTVRSRTVAGAARFAGYLARFRSHALRGNRRRGDWPASCDSSCKPARVRCSARSSAVVAAGPRDRTAQDRCGSTRREASLWAEPCTPAAKVVGPDRDGSIRAVTWTDALVAIVLSRKCAAHCSSHHARAGAASSRSPVEPIASRSRATSPRQPHGAGVLDMGANAG